MNVRRKEWKNLKIMESMKTKRKKELNKEDFQKKKNAKGLMTAAQKEQCKVKRKLEQRLHW